MRPEASLLPALLGAMCACHAPATVLPTDAAQRVEVADGGPGDLGSNGLGDLPATADASGVADTAAPHGDVGADLGVDAGPAADAAALDAQDTAPDVAVWNGTGLSPDFRAWLAASKADVAALARDDLVGGSFGGRSQPGEILAHDPVIFVHGNSDKALGSSATQSGWTASRNWFLDHGYSGAELYATTWGPADANQASQQEHSRKHVLALRAFVQAVLAYTGAQKVDIIAHSMGVTLARKVVLGGAATDPNDGGDYDVGAPLTDQVDAFVAIAGANLGLVSCFQTAASTPTCGAVNGLYPGAFVGMQVVGRSSFLENLLEASAFEGAFRYALWSSVDEVIGYGNLVYGKPTSRLPGQTGEITWATAPYGHFGLKDLTGKEQLALVRDHLLP